MAIGYNIPAVDLLPARQFEVAPAGASIEVDYDYSAGPCAAEINFI
jgi:hypothetical protein